MSRSAAAPNESNDLVASEIRVRAKRLGLPAKQTTLLVSRGSAALKTLSSMEARAGKPIDGSNVQVGTNRETLRPFESLGEQLRAVALHTSSHITDPRLYRLAGPPSGMSEGIASGGGFMIEPRVADTVLDRSFQTGQILRHVFRYPCPEGASQAAIPAWDETSRADGQRKGGVQAFWLDEADQLTAKKPKLRRIDPALRKLVALCYLTNELDADAPGFTDLAEKAFADEITFSTEAAIVGGGGSILGLLKAPALITVAAEGGQTAGTINGTNVAKMFARSYCPPNPDDIVWLVNQNALPQVFTLQQSPVPAGATSLVGNMYVPAVAGDVDAPYGRLLGRPVLPAEHCASIGSVGDIVLTDLSQYVVTDKNPRGLRSIHVKFLTDELAFRITYRVGGQPIWHQPVTPKNGTDTISSIVALGAR